MARAAASCRPRSGIATDARLNIYVADWGNDRIAVFGHDGEPRACLNYPVGQRVLRRPAGVAVATDLAGYVADWDNNCVRVSEPSGE